MHLVANRGQIVDARSHQPRLRAQLADDLFGWHQPPGIGREVVQQTPTSWR